MSSSLKLILFYIGIGIDIVAILIALYFIITDSIGFSSSDNTGLTIITLLFCGWVGLCWYLKIQGYPGIGAILAWIPALPMALYGLMVLLFIILKVDSR